MDKEHDHIGPWWGIGLSLAAIAILTYAGFTWHSYRIDSAESRIMELEQRVECAAPESLFFDADGNAVCLTNNR